MTPEPTAPIVTSEPNVVRLRDGRSFRPSVKTFESEILTDEAPQADRAAGEVRFDDSNSAQRARAIADALNTFDHVAVTAREFVQVYGRDAYDVYLRRARKAQAALTAIITELENAVSMR